MNIVEWIQTATRPILLKKDREQAARELEDHFEDRCAALRARGVSLVQAEQEALAAMGDAKETGRLLRKAYQPVRSVFLLLSKAALVLACLILLNIVLLRQAGQLPSSTYRSGYPDEIDLYEHLFHPDELWSFNRNILLRGSGTGQARVGLYRIRAQEAVAGIGGMTVSNNEYIFITVLLRTDQPWSLSAPDTLVYYLEARDNLGNVYQNNPSPNVTSKAYVQYGGFTLGRSYYFVSLERPVCSGLSGLEWVDLIYDHAGQSFSIHVTFEEEVS